MARTAVIPRVNQRISRHSSPGLTPRSTAVKMEGTTNSSSRLAATPQNMRPAHTLSTPLQSFQARRIIKAQLDAMP